MPLHAPAGKHAQRALDVGAAVAETLLAEIIRHAGLGDRGDAHVGGGAIALNFAKYNFKLVAFERAALELAAVPRRFEHAEFRMLQRRPVRPGRLAGKMHRKRLPGDGMAVLEPGVTHGLGRHARVSRQFARDEIGVRAALLHAQEYVLAGTVRSEAEIFVDDEIFGRGAQRAGQRWAAVGVGKFDHVVSLCRLSLSFLGM